MDKSNKLTIIPKKVTQNLDVEQLDFASRDLAIRSMVNELGKKKMLMLQKSSEIEHLKDTNDLLTNVAEDYHKYEEYIIKEKKLQQEAMNNIVKHLEKILNESELSDSALAQAKLQKQTLLSSLSEIKNSLDEIIKK